MAEDSRTIVAIKGVREALALARDVAILAAVAILLLAPGRAVPTLEAIGRALARAGFSRVSIAGFEQDLAGFKEQVQEARLGTQLAGETIAQVRQQLASDPSIKPEVRESLARASALVGQSSDQLDAAEQRVEGAAQPPPARPAQPDSWGIVIGADRDLAEAEREVVRASKNGFAGAFVVRRDGWYRTVIPASSRESAEAQLRKISQAIRSGGYIRNLAEWCPSGTARADPRFQDCGR